jgi:hypothetical protein
MLRVDGEVDSVIASKQEAQVGETLLRMSVFDVNSHPAGMSMAKC